MRTARAPNNDILDTALSPRTIWRVDTETLQLCPTSSTPADALDLERIQLRPAPSDWAATINPNTLSGTLCKLLYSLKSDRTFQRAFYKSGDYTLDALDPDIKRAAEIAELFIREHLRHGQNRWSPVEFHTVLKAGRLTFETAEFQTEEADQVAPNYYFAVQILRYAKLLTSTGYGYLKIGRAAQEIAASVKKG